MSVPDVSRPEYVRLPRTIKAIRAALPADQRGRFAVEVEGADLSRLPQVVRLWWARAIVMSDQQTRSALERSRAGQLATVPVEDVLPGWGA